MRVAVIDGQGGGIGKVIIEKLKVKFSEEIEVIALGTNAMATSAMLKAGANEAATGESAILYNSSRVDIIMGTIAIIAANSMLGELTPLMSRAVAESCASKVLIPLNRYKINIAGVRSEPLPHYIDDALEIVKKIIRGEENV